MVKITHLHDSVTPQVLYFPSAYPYSGSGDSSVGVVTLLRDARQRNRACVLRPEFCISLQPTLILVVGIAQLV